VRRFAFASMAILPLVLVTACGKSALPAPQSRPVPATSTVPTGRKGPLPPVTTTPGPPIAAAPWPERTLAPVPGLLAVDPAGNDAYALVSETTAPEQGPYRLQRTDLVDHRVQDGPLFPQSSLAFLAGDLWVFGAVDMGSVGPSTQAQAYEVDSGTLSVVRTLTLPPARSADASMALAAGPEGSVWIGYSQNLLRVDAATGAVQDEITVPSGLLVSDVAVDPAGQFLYVAYTHNVGSPSVGVPGGSVVYEYDATSGQELVSTVKGPASGSIAGASLVAVPGGVWVSFRVGMSGVTLLLRQSDLAAVAGSTSDASIGSAFAWMMGASVAYGDGTLFLAQVTGLVACIDPQTGEVRGSETLPNSPGQDGAISVFVVDGSSGLVYGGDDNGVIAFTPPASCWS